MTLQTTGAISLGNVQTEFGGANPIAISEYYRNGGRVPSGGTNNGVPTSGQISISQFRGTQFSDLYPNPVDWSNADSSSGYYQGGRAATTGQTISGINSAITLQLNLESISHTDSPGGIDIHYAFSDITANGAGWAYLGTQFTAGTVLGQIVVTPGAFLKFRFTTGGSGMGEDSDGSMSAQVGVYNVSVPEQSLLDIMIFSASWLGDQGSEVGMPE